MYMASYIPGTCMYVTICLIGAWIQHYLIDFIAESRATMASSVAGSESVFASRETGVSSVPSEMSAAEEEKIFKVVPTTWSAPITKYSVFVLCRTNLWYSVLQSENFQRDLFIMERVVNLNTYQTKQALYRNFPIIPGRWPLAVWVNEDVFRNVVLILLSLTADGY